MSVTCMNYDHIHTSLKPGRIISFVNRMANLKFMIQHNSVELIESFKKDLVGYANTMWQHGIVPTAVKDKVLDVHSADENYRANYLVTNLTRKFIVLEDMSPQIDCMKTLLQSLEDREEKELANKIRIELKRDFQIELQPSGGAPVQPKSEPKLGMFVSPNKLY